MSIFRGPGILLNPSTVGDPSSLPQAFALTLAAGTNTFALTDELGAIAYAFHEGGALNQGRRLFGILESGYTLADKASDISYCLASATSDTLQSAMLRSNRALERVKQTDEKIAAILVQHNSMTAAAEAVGITQSTISRRIKLVADGSPLAAFKGVFRRGGSQPTVSDEAIAEMLEQHDTITAAAKAVGITPSSISQRIKLAVDVSPLAAFKGVFRRRGHPLTISDEEIAAILKQHDTITAAAEAVGITQSAVSRRIKLAAEDSSLAAFKGVFRRGHGKFTVGDEEIAEMLEQHDTIAAAAEAVGIAPSAVSRRIKRAADDSPLAAFKGRYTFKGRYKSRPPTVSDEEIVAALKQHDTITAAAEAVGITQSAVSWRIKRAADDSPLARFQGAFKSSKVSVEDLVAALEQHDTITAAAEAVGIDKSAISRRIKRAADDSPLAAFKGRHWSRPPTVSDEAIAAALEHHNTITAAAHEVGLTGSTVAYRIRTAPKDSPLAAFKDVFRRRGRPLTISDEEIAAALEHHNTITAAAHEMGLTGSTVAYRIRTAPKDSPLAAFKGKLTPRRRKK